MKASAGILSDVRDILQHSHSSYAQKSRRVNLNCESSEVCVPYFKSNSKTVPFNSVESENSKRIKSELYFGHSARLLKHFEAQSESQKS